MTLFFSPVTLSFLDDAIHTNIPAEAVAISAEDHAVLLAAQAAGRIIAADDDGNPVTIDPPAPTQGELMRRLRGRRDQLLRLSDFSQLPDTPFSAEDRTAWSDYRQTLRDLPETWAEDPGAVIWPAAPAAH